MPRPGFSVLRNELLQAGIAPGHVHRSITELNEHFEDLVDAAMGDGRGRDEAERQAVERLGDLQGIATAMKQHPELRSWAWRWPRLAFFVYPLACVAALPVVPVIAGVRNAPQLARWTACLLLSGLVTAFMFLVMQLSITLT